MSFSNIGKHKYSWVLNIIRCVYLKVDRWYLNKIRCDKKKKYPNTLHFTHFDKKKNTHISRCKIVHLYKSAIVTMHICMVTVALAFIILHFFLSPSRYSLIFNFSLSPLSLFISGPSVQPHRHDQSSLADQPHRYIQSNLILADQSSLTDTISLIFDPF